MPVIYLLRHAQSTANTKGVLAGQDYAVGLSDQGSKQAKALVKVIEQLRPSRIFCSPLTRCKETIDPYLSKYPNCKFEFREELIEMDYGSWSGKKLNHLQGKKDWRLVQNVPSKFTFPNGESFKSLRRRVELILKGVSKEKGPLMFVTHGDVIKMALSIASNSKLDDFQRFIVEPGSISTINYGLTKLSIISSNNFAPKSFVNVVNQVALGGGDIIKKLRWFRR